MNIRCITNNPLVIEKELKNAESVTGDTLSVLLSVKNYILKGHKLISHPLSSSIRPDISPYKSILITNNAESVVDSESLILINNAVEYTGNLMKIHDTPVSWDEKSLEDFQYIDMDIISNLIE